jgi:hypothetical protein
MVRWFIFAPPFAQAPLRRAEDLERLRTGCEKPVCRRCEGSLREDSALVTARQESPELRMCQDERHHSGFGPTEHRHRAAYWCFQFELVDPSKPAWRKL